MKYSIFLLFLFYSVMASSQDWQEDYNVALEQAEEQHKPLILVFSGSDWCAPCIRLDKEIWQSENFKKFSKENYILYRADFPRKKANKLSPELTDQNNKLAANFNSKGYFPLVVVLNEKEQVLGETGYKKLSPDEYISLLNSFLK
ncbi:thioredoxin family protein [Kriegella aquimaris]|nr:thioredoxin family protein [Kriegella aquimaris]